jgi:ribonucleoside-diphosphate reductase alpha chain
MVKSIMDYLGRWLALKFLTKAVAKKYHNGELIDQAYATGSKSKDAFAMRLPIVDEGSHVDMEDIETKVETKTHSEVVEAAKAAESAPSKMEQAKLQGFTGAICGACGSLKMKRNGSCEVCLDCGATSGCS